MIRIQIPLPSRSRLEDEYQHNAEMMERVLFELQRRIKLILAKAGMQPTIKYRLKSFDSYYHKLLRRVSTPPKTKDWHQITDLLGIRVVCPFMADLPVVERLLSQEFEILEREKKGAEFSFKEFGYESLHYLLRLPQDVQESFHVADDMVCELQLRTILQDAWAEVEHELVYKSDYTPFDESLRRKLAALNANLSLADMVFHEIREYQRELQRQLRKRRTDFWELVRRSEDEKRGILIADGELRGTWVNPDANLESPPEIDCPPNVSAPAFNLSGGEATIPTGGGFGIGLDAGLAANPGLAHYDVVDGQLLKALYAHNAHRYQEAIALYSAILEMQPRQAVLTIVLVHRGMVHFAMGKYPAAIEDFGRSMDGEGDHRRAYYYRAVAQRQLGAYSEALDDLNQCLSIDPFQSEALLSRAQTLVKLGDYATALQDVDSALALHPEDDEAHRFREVLTGKLGL